MLEIEAHIAESGWDQPARLYALVATADLVREEPDLARAMGLDDTSAEGSLTPVEQDQLPPGDLLEDALGLITWPPSVVGCAAVVERLVLPPDAEGDVPDDVEAAAEFAREHPDRQEVRIVAGVTRAGSAYSAMRLRAHDDAQSVVGGTDLVPGLTTLLGSTLDNDDMLHPETGPDA